ncbi:hypothetical protein OUZ56_029711 [Daphnia magna]|uniref:Uncharacterized protein n=1 Tax=Daphnia magna TaxID=35525 RepID=A0ABR0B7L8_9CRUS|nr:hypothetical protein OUZ56_029711 [Daphnia magna]
MELSTNPTVSDIKLTVVGVNEFGEGVASEVRLTESPSPLVDKSAEGYKEEGTNKGLLKLTDGLANSESTYTWRCTSQPSGNSCKAIVKQKKNPLFDCLLNCDYADFTFDPHDQVDIFRETKKACVERKFTDPRKILFTEMKKRKFLERRDMLGVDLATRRLRPLLSCRGKFFPTGMVPGRRLCWNGRSPCPAHCFLHPCHEELTGRLQNMHWTAVYKVSGSNEGKSMAMNGEILVYLHWWGTIHRGSDLMN